MAARLRRVILVIVLFSAFVSVTTSSSGLYVDNGLDQTVIQRSMTRQERMLVEHELLNLLGLPDRPRKTRNAPLNKSAPIFLLGIYKSLGGEDDAKSTRTPEISLSGDDLNAIDESDVIMTFQSKNNHAAGLGREMSRKLWFDVAEAPVGETIFKAKLRLYQSSDYTCDPENIFTVSVHKVVSVGRAGGLELELISTKNTSATNEGWIEINITRAFTDWIAFPSENKGVYVAVHSYINPDHEVHPEEIGLITKDNNERQPFVVAFLKASGGANKKSSLFKRKKRESRKHKKNRNSAAAISSKNPSADLLYLWSSKSCKIQTLYVNFKDLGFQDWIIAPLGYGAFYCSGECNFPLNAHMNATNHAIVQTLIHLLIHKEVPKPCCVPTKLTPMSIIYSLDDTSVILKKKKNMVVKSCGCH